MQHIKLKKKKHLVIFQLNKELPLELIENITQKLSDELDPEFKIMLSQTEATILTLDD